MKSYFSKNFKYLRKQRNISQSELANALSISRSKIASYEGRGVEPKLQLLVEMARYFDIDIQVLISKDIEALVNESGQSAIKPFQSAENNIDSSQEGALYLNVSADENLAQFLSESASIVKMLEGFKVFYKIKMDDTPLEDLSEPMRKVHHDIQNVIYLIDYLLEHNKNLITVLKNAEAA